MVVTVPLVRPVPALLLAVADVGGVGAVPAVTLELPRGAVEGGTGAGLVRAIPAVVLVITIIILLSSLL